ncbi:peptidoglycan/xylan/chitin deacetylase (PgdA/CDA1 family) [Ureibacillus xyleni]|uniref:Peptidoglycan/xylan/chitin deacetylase (PgdA/CDA1 family) n=1 Tax=Ureibacillus xyleni TaxID=614648 RepID=A0A285RHK8_9BACL|nr:hypothetical protein [Ureibacillus xyleni]SOB93615.1 peptidoglycan/xylan/chitin deacetylase (PgdA/CDA1 family) [Ureibacillus xyleni]
MEFTINAYVQLLELLKSKGYEFCFYNEINEKNKTVILRHDVDFTLDKAVEMAVVESQIGVKSTYFVLLSTNFYNVFSKQSFEKLIQIANLGHEIGLHFDETRYDIHTLDELKRYVEKEAEILSKLLDTKVNVISMHRPSKFTLNNDIQFEQFINSYSSKFFKDMKYVSDSRMNWRENPIEIIESGQYEKLHILTHPFWYSTKNETMEAKLKDFIKQSIADRYDFINSNFTAFDQVIRREEIIG